MGNSSGKSSNSVYSNPTTLPDIRFHDLRHSVVSLLFAENMHPKIVQEILGHSNIAITLDTYSHMLPTLHGDAPGRLDDLLGE